MKVSREKAVANRERIIDAAAALFRTKGFDGIGVADIMKAAELTHGGFYGHFESKDDLIAKSNEKAMERAAKAWSRVTAEAPDRAFAALLDHYLTPRHRDDPSRGCSFAALGGDVARCAKPVRTAYAEGLEPLIGVLARALPNGSKATRRRKAIAALAEMIGAVILARAAAGTPLSDEILSASRQQLLDGA